MAEDIITLISELERKAENIRKRFTDLDTERRILAANVEKLEKEILLYKQKITDLENKNRILHVTDVFSNNSGSETLKTKKVLNEMVQEIDRCVALLNR